MGYFDDNVMRVYNREKVVILPENMGQEEVKNWLSRVFCEDGGVNL